MPTEPIPTDVLDEDHPCNVCGRHMVRMNRFGRLVCERCLNDQGDDAPARLRAAREGK